jgi:HlyD family secretion protein
MAKDGSRPKIRWGRWFSLFAATLLTAAGIWWAFKPKPIIVDAATVTRGPLRVTVDEDGRTRVRDRHVVSAPVAGNLARIDLHPGDVVHAGDVVARLEPTPPPLLDSSSRDELAARLRAAEAAHRQARATIGRAEAARKFAVSEVARQEELLARGSIGKRSVDVAKVELETASKDVESAKFAAKVAAQDVEMARAALRRLQPAQRRAARASKAPPQGGAAVAADGTPGTVDEGASSEALDVTSPIDGVVLRVYAESGGVVVPGAPLLEIADLTNLEVVVDVLTSDAVAISPADPAVLSGWGGEHALAGRVRLVEPSATTKISALGVEEQRVNVVVDLVDPPELRQSLGDGYRVDVAVEVWSGSDVLQVPTSALFRRGDRWAVWVMEGDVCHPIDVDVGRREGLLTEIVQGIAEGATVILHPPDDLAEGALVKARGDVAGAPTAP